MSETPGQTEPIRVFLVDDHGLFRSGVRAELDRGVPDDRKGIAASIEGRMERAGGQATIVTSPGNGTEVELHLPRRQP